MIGVPSDDATAELGSMPKDRIYIVHKVAFEKIVLHFHRTPSKCILSGHSDDSIIALMTVEQGISFPASLNVRPYYFRR